MQHFKHTQYPDGKIGVQRDIDKKVFGTYRAVCERTFKKYRIANGEVQIKFCGKWNPCEEINPDWTDHLVGVKREMAEEKGSPMYGQMGWVRIWYRS